MILDRDFIHLNDVEVLSTDLAAAFPQFDAGDILISLRNLNLLLVIDPTTERIKWSMTGPFLRQHDPDFLSNGHISVFDNRRDDSSGDSLGGSRILEINPLTGAVSTVFSGSAGLPFYTETMGDHQRLENGNTLITESESGHAFEISPEGEIVWSYVNRWGERSAAMIGRATRYPKYYGQSVRSMDCTE